MLRRVIVLCSLAIACHRPTTAPSARPGTSPTPAAQERGHAIGIVTGAPWMGGGPSAHTTWRVVAALDERHDIVPVDLDRAVPRSVGTLVVPQLPSLTQPQLDRLWAAIDGGMAAIVVADPMPIFDLRLMPGEPIPDESAPTMFVGHEVRSPAKGDASGFLARLGVAWRPDRVLVDTEGTDLAPLQLVVAEVAAPLQGPVMLAYGGEIESIGDRSTFVPLVTTRRPVRSGKSEDYVQMHPLFGPSLASDEGQVREPEAHVRTVVARIEAAPGTRRGTVIVAADLDLFDDMWFGNERRTTIAIANPRLFGGLVAELAGAGRDPERAVLGAALLDASVRDRVTEIDVIGFREVEVPPPLAERGSSRHVPEWVRLRRDGQDWSVRSTFTEPADAARVAALLDALVQAKWEPERSRGDTLRDPSTVEYGNAIRVIARDGDGATVLDVLIGRDPGQGLARGAFDPEQRHVQLPHDIFGSAVDFSRGIALGIPRARIASATVTTYRIDVARGKIEDTHVKPASEANIAALLGARLFLRRSSHDARLEMLQAFGFYKTPEGKLLGSIGDVELKLQGGKMIRVLFGEPREQGRAVMLEGHDDGGGEIRFYTVDEATAQRVLAGK